MEACFKRPITHFWKSNRKLSNYKKSSVLEIISESMFCYSVSIQFLTLNYADVGKKLNVLLQDGCLDVNRVESDQWPKTCHLVTLGNIFLIKSYRKPWKSPQRLFCRKIFRLRGFLSFETSQKFTFLDVHWNPPWNFHAKVKRKLSMNVSHECLPDKLQMLEWLRIL